MVNKQRVRIVISKGKTNKTTIRNWNDSMEFFDDAKRNAFPNMDKDLYIKGLLKEAKARNIVFV